MPDEKKFGSSFFGGFKKKSVINYINNIIVEHEKELKKLKESSDAANEQLKESLEQERALCKKYKEKVIKLEENVDEYNENVSSVMQQKDELLKLREQHSLKLEEKIKELEEELTKFKELKIEEENKIKKAEFIAKERVNQIIRQGKVKITNEYNERAKKWRQEEESLKQDALREVEIILNNAAARVSTFNIEVKKEVDGIVKDAEEKAKDIVCAARIIADEILKKSANIAFEQTSNFACDKNVIKSKFDVSFLNEKAKEEVKNAMKKLEHLNLFKEKVVRNYFKRERNLKIARKPNFNSLKRKEK